MYKTIMKIDGMMCGMCEAHVNDAVRSACPVRSVSSSHKKGVTEIVTEEQPDTDAIKAVIEKTGYAVKDVEVAPYEKKGFRLFGRK